MTGAKTGLVQPENSAKMEYKDFQSLKPIVESFLHETNPSYSKMDFVAQINLVGKVVFWLQKFTK